MAGLLKVGLTGGIACGRSTLSRFLRRPGWLVIDADAIVHGLMTRGGAAVGEILKVFGPAVGSTESGIDRKELGKVVFKDAAARRRLESIIHPGVYRCIDADTEAFERRAGSGIVVVDAALMVETGSWRRYHRLVVAHCPAPVQLRRLMNRDGLSEEEARARLAAQAPLEEKIALAHHTIYTGGTLEETRARTEAVALRLEEEMRALPGPGPDPAGGGE